MQGVEALTMLIHSGDVSAEMLRAQFDAMSEDGKKNDDHGYRQKAEDYALASAVCQAMLNTALPIARWRVFVEIEQEQPKRTKFQESIAATDEYTICSPSMVSVISGLMAVSQVPTNVNISVWEQRVAGADMVLGYKGPTKGHSNYRAFLQQLRQLEITSTVQ